jgi:hypothetical protein
VTREQVRAAMHRQPFLGFTVHLVDGRSYLAVLKELSQGFHEKEGGAK